MVDEANLGDSAVLRDGEQANDIPDLRCSAASQVVARRRRVA
jgi:hypothetical protein